MSLIQEILVHLLENQQIEVHIPALSPEMLAQMVESVCYQTLQQILEVVHDDSLDDAACFQRIEKIICACEAIGSDGGSRHDF